MRRPGFSYSFLSWKLSDEKVRRCAAFVLLVTMLTLSVPSPVLAAAWREGAARATALARTAEAIVARSTRLFRSQSRGQSRGMPQTPVRAPGIAPQDPPTTFDRQARVASIRTNVSQSVVLRSHEPILFSAIPVDSDGAAIHGLSIEWKSSDHQVIFVKKNGQAQAGNPGTATVTATAGNARQQIEVTVVTGSKENFGGKKRENSSRRRQVSQNPAPAFTALASGKSATKRHHSFARDRSTQPGNSLALRPLAPPAPLRNPNDDPLPDTETGSLYLPPNNVGAPPGKTRAGGATRAVATEGTETGNKNFTFNLPIVELPGRGIDVSLDLSYNSLLYNKSTDPEDGTPVVTYDVDTGWPAAGFRVGYGQIEDQGEFGFTLTDTDGTRHALSPTGTYTYETTDGSFMHFTGGQGWGSLFRADGSRVLYGAAGNGLRSFPTQITDHNGNYILISYVNGVGPKISSIQDTLGRFITFSYASNGDLTSITAPTLGSQNREVMRFFYEDLSLNASTLFSNLVLTSVPTSTRVLKYAFLSNSVEAGNPHVGYRFDYSAYGMVYQIVQFRGLTLNSGGTAVASDGTQAAKTTYNYQGTPINTTTGLTDVPSYTTRTDDWAGRTTSVNGNPPSYSFTMDEATGVATVTAPDGTVTESHSIVHPNFWDHGLISDSYVNKSGSNFLSHTKIDWEEGVTGSPRLWKIRTTNEVNQTKATVLTYTSYDNVASESLRDFTTDGSVSATELRRSETTYVTSSSYTARYLVRLPATKKVFAGGSSTPIARVDYAYDNYGTDHASMTSRDDIIMHDPAFDPFQQTQESCDWVCHEYDPWWVNCVDWRWDCSYYNPYDATTDFRGNITSITTYPDANSTSGTIVHGTTYDIAGNIMATQVDCCQQKSFTYSGAGTNGSHDYAYPISVSSGGGGTTLTASATYDYNTGLVVTKTDENNQVVTAYYNSDSLRLDQVEFPGGGVTSFDYFDGLAPDESGNYHFFVKTSSKLDAPNNEPRWVESFSYFDGRENLARTFQNYTAADGWATQDIQYDVMGRAYRRSNPYYSPGYDSGAVNPDGFWITTTWDPLARITQVTMPRGDNNSSTTSLSAAYDGMFATITDQAGKTRRKKTDAIGRLVRLDEPDASGSLGSSSSPARPTSYEYDALDNLVHIIQPEPGGSVTQHRYFKYDSLSRMIRERQVEHNTNASYDLSDALTGNSSWSRKIEYNSAGLITDGYDARGLHTQYAYDGLNRLTHVTYSDSTPACHYYYDSQSLPSNAPSFDRGYSAGRIVATTYGSSSAITGTYLGYDAAGRVLTQKQVTGSNVYTLGYAYNAAGVLTSETYPSGRTLSYSYDEGGRLAEMKDAATTFASVFKYAPQGGLKSEQWGNGAVHSIEYNRRLQTSKIRLRQTADEGSTTLQQYEYGYGTFNSSNGAVDTSKNNGQIGKIVATIGGATEWTQGFTYDSLSRLANVAEYAGDMGATTFQQGYTYDHWGNRAQSANTTLNLPSVTSAEIEKATNRFINTGSTPTTYDAAGNITTDTKFRNLKYEYDANGRQTSVKLINNTTVQTSVYDGSGQRVQTAASGVTRTMIYDILGQQVADYQGSALERENLYRGGQLLTVIETVSAPPPTSLAATPIDSGTKVSLNWSTASGATNYRIERRGATGTYALAATTTSTSLTDTTVTSGNAYLYRVCAADGQGNCTSTYSNLALGAAINFPTDPTITSTTENPATATTIKAAHINELRTAVNAVRTLAGLSSADWTNDTVSSGSTIYADDIRDLRANLHEALEQLGIQTSAYDDSTLAGAPNGTAVKKVHITQLRTRATSGSGTQGSGGGGGVMYVLADAQGGNRAVMNSSGVGTSAVVARHDFLPFGEEIAAGIGSRTGAKGYGASDNNRRKFAWTERDSITGLDHTWFRKYESLAGRWTSPDSLSGDLTNPQSLNRYTYVQNDPVNLIDPTGLCVALHLILDIFVDGVHVFRIDLGVVGYSGCGAGLGGRARDREISHHARKKRKNTRKPSTVCEQMAADAQKAADKALKKANGNAKKALGLFDSDFNSQYLAHPMKTRRDAYDLYKKRGGQVFGTNTNRGSSGFNTFFLDSGGGVIHREASVDQTHHFAAYFSGGINGQYAATTAHAWDDLYRDNNKGDYDLGNAAYGLGEGLADNPSLLSVIGALIYITICNPLGV